MSNVKKVSKLLTLDLTDIPQDKVRAAKKKVGNFVVENILRDVATGKSPLTGKAFRRLTKSYAKAQKSGVTLPDLELEGDMLFSLKALGQDVDNEFLEVGIFDESQAPKADGHNQISLESRLWAARTDRAKYKRRFIPDANEKFRKKITDGIENILDSYRERPQAPSATEEDFDFIDIARPTERVSTPETTRVATSTGDIFGDEAIEYMLLEELDKLGRL